LNVGALIVSLYFETYVCYDHCIINSIKTFESQFVVLLPTVYVLKGCNLLDDFFTKHLINVFNKSSVILLPKIVFVKQDIISFIWKMHKVHVLKIAISWNVFYRIVGEFQSWEPIHTISSCKVRAVLNWRANSHSILLDWDEFINFRKQSKCHLWPLLSIKEPWGQIVLVFVWNRRVLINISLNFRIIFELR